MSLIATEQRQIARSKIMALEEELFKYPPTEMPVEHYFGDGVYARQITIPAGTVATGHIHKHEHISVLSKGKLSVITENGRATYEAPATFVSPPGTKKAVYAHTDVIFTTFHLHNGETDVEKLKENLIFHSYDELENTQQYTLRLEE